MWEIFVFSSLLPSFLLFLGIKAVATGDVDLYDGRKLGRRASMALGLLTIMLSVCVIGFLFSKLILRAF